MGENKNQNKQKVLVHFKGWNSRWDKWYHADSGLLKTLNEFRRERKMHSATRNEGLYQIMRQKYPRFVSTSLAEQTLNSTAKRRQRKHRKRTDERSKRNRKRKKRRGGTQ